jgi:putative transposase
MKEVRYKGSYPSFSFDEELLGEIKTILEKRPTYGYRRVTALLNKELSILGKDKVNHKRIYRIMKEHHLLLAKANKKPTRTHDGKIITLKSNMRWCSDYFTIRCWNGDGVHVAFSLDTCDREAMRYIASTKGVDGDMIRNLMLETVEYRFGQPKAPHKIQWLSDNGPCYTAHETVHFGRLLGFEVCTTPAYCPESNGMAEAFVKTIKRDYVYVSDLSDAQTVMRQLPLWFKDYNENAPHKGLKMRSPMQFLSEMLAS